MSSGVTLQPATLHRVFMDFENVSKLEPALLEGASVHLTLLLGPRPTKFDASVVERLLQRADSVQIFRLTSAAKNAVDFALSYYLGRAAHKHPHSQFHIISKDKGFDPLVEHLCSREIIARRYESCSELVSVFGNSPGPTAQPTVPTISETKSKPALNDLETRVLSHLRQPMTKLPKTEAKLVSYLVTHLGRKYSKEEVSMVVRGLGQTGHLFIGSDGKITYHLG